MILILEIRILHSMKVQKFEIPCIPNTLVITRHPTGRGFEIHIDDIDGGKRAWFAVDIYGVEFLDKDEDDAPTMVVVTNPPGSGPN